MRIDAYMQVNQLYKAGKPRSSAKSSKSDSTDSLEISSIGKDYQVARKAFQRIQLRYLFVHTPVASL